MDAAWVDGMRRRELASEKFGQGLGFGIEGGAGLSVAYMVLDI